MSRPQFDVIVVGAGHAGCEAAKAASRLGASVALVTGRKDRIGFMSCNPAIGGLAKGQLVYEVDALGGVMGRITDRAGIQFRRLNMSKGPAVRSNRAQCDKAMYAQLMGEEMARTPGVEIIEAEVESLSRLPNCGVYLNDGSLILGRAVVVTTGTFLAGLMHTGESKQEGGRVGDHAAYGLSRSLRELGIELRRLKTGTPPRLDHASIDYARTEEQTGDAKAKPFSVFTDFKHFPALPQLSCWITHTNGQTHEIIDKNLHRSPMYSGQIQGVGPRYCPSIEDKVKRFSERDRHQLFLEPEGHSTNEVYVNGLSTSLPRDVQDRVIHSIVGLEQARILRFGYAVEYDAVCAIQLRRTLAHKDHDWLFFAGQINGTSGYEEAAAQGLVAGLNAALYVQDREPFTLARSDAYIGVLIDDLTTKDISEPYRMFTSRAEHRLNLREDNADVRLSKFGIELGLFTRAEIEKIESREVLCSELKKSIEAFSVKREKSRIKGFELLRRPEITLNSLVEMGLEISPEIPGDLREKVEIEIKYEGYIRRDIDLLRSVSKSDFTKVPSALDFSIVPGLSNEVVSQLKRVRPETFGQMRRVPGITPAAIANLWIFLKKKKASFPEKNPCT